MKITRVSFWLTSSLILASHALAAGTAADGYEKCLAANAFSAIDETYTVCTAALEGKGLQPEKRAKVLSQRANVFYFAQRLDLAIEDASEAIKLDPGRVEAYVRRANARILLGDLHQAREDISLALALNPEHANAYISLGWLYSHTPDDLGKREPVYLRALEIEPENGLALLNMGRIYFYDKRETEKGLAYIERLIAIGPEKLSRVAYWRNGLDIQSQYDFYAYARIERASMLRSLARNDQALADYDWAIEKYPDGSRGYLERGRLRSWNMQDMSGALSDAERALALYPAAEEPKLLNLSLLLSLKRTSEALKMADQIIDGGATHAGRAEALEVRSRIYKMLNDPERSLSDIERYLTMMPQMIPPYQKLLAQRGYYSGDMNGEPSEALRIGLQACIADPDC
ncbi:MAG: tetratricopeptide repeat protein [Aestuariivirga sp.]